MGTSCQNTGALAVEEAGWAAVGWVEAEGLEEAGWGVEGRWRAEEG